MSASRSKKKNQTGAASKTTAKKKKAGARKQTSQNKKNDDIRQRESFMEITMLVVFAVSLLLMLANFGVGGAVGDVVARFFFGLFGCAAWVFPVLLFFGTAFCLVNADHARFPAKAAGWLLAFLGAEGLAHLLTLGCKTGDKITGYYKYGAEQKLGGGILGGGEALALRTAFGTAGAYVILSVVFLIALILIFERPILAPLKRKSKEAYLHAKEQQVSRQERRRSIAFDQLKIEPPGTGGESFLDPTGQGKTSENVETAVMESGDEGSFDPDKTGIDASQTPAPRRRKRSRPAAEDMESIRAGIVEEENSGKKYQAPPLSLLKRGKQTSNSDSGEYLRETAKKLQNTLHNFGVNVTVINASCGPTVTRYELQPEQGVKVSRIVSLADDIKLNLAATDIRIEAPIPGKAAVGIEVPNATNSAVMLRDLLESREFQEFPSDLAFAVGKDIAGKTVVTDIGKMPHLLIAGATGSGKSVCINTLIMSILYKSPPEDVRLIMIDPKVVELSVYNGIPHLYIPVVTDPKKAAGALNWAVAEMTDRYKKFAECGVRDLKGYNEKIAQIRETADENAPKKLPKIVIIVDELADLMMVSPGEVEDAICRLAQLARAAGIHLIIATQRPSVDVITGLIKANMPSRIAFAVSSGVDSRTILDMNGAEKLLGKGDMLYYPQNYQKPARLQGSFVTDHEVEAVVAFLKENQDRDAPAPDETIMHMMEAAPGPGGVEGQTDRDAYFVDAGKFIIEKDKASIGMLQRFFKIGFNRAARIMDQLADAGVVGPEEGTKPRKILMSMEEFENYIEESV